MPTHSRISHATKTTKAAQVLQKAQELAAQVESWADFANALFDAEHGLVSQAFPRRNERQAFFKTKEYAAIDQLLSQLMERFGVADGATPKDSSRFVVRLPRTLRLALEREAAQKGVGLNQLVLAKLAAPCVIRSAGES